MERDIRNILIVQLGDIGDVVLSIPAFRAAGENFPRARVTVAVRQKAVELIGQIPWVHGAVAVNQERRSPVNELRHQWTFFSGLRQRRFDLAYDLRTGIRGAILTLLAGAGERIGFHDPEAPLRNRLFTRLHRLEYRHPQPVSDYYAGLLRAEGLTVAHERPEMRVTPEMRERAGRILAAAGVPPGRPVIAIQPFSLWRYKEWGADKYALLIRRILAAGALSVVITGSPDERPRAEEMAGRLNEQGSRVFNLAGRTSLGELAALLAACRLFIGSDSAGMHIAAAVGTPTAVLFGPSSPSSWAPVGEDHAVVQKDLPCVPCREKGCDGSGVSRCLEELDVDEVWAVVRGRFGKLGLAAV